MKVKIISILSFVAMVFLSRCANVVAPTGGPKDLTPPKVVEAIPAARSTGFNGRRISLTFDEYITLDNAAQNVLFSPPLDTKPDIKLSNKTVVIRLKENLRPNTTYSIQLGSAVKDLHEGNLFKEDHYTFSTGDRLDTLTLSGKVLDANDKKPSEGLFVCLYAPSADSLATDSIDVLFQQPMKRQPDYLAKTDKEGKFTLRGLPDRAFLAVALKDMNSNLLYDLPNETVAFLDTLVAASQPSDLTLYAFTARDTTQMLLEKKLVEEGMLRFVFRQPADSVRIETTDTLADAFHLAEVWSPTHDTLWWYFTPHVMDSLQVHIQFDTVIDDHTRYALNYRETAQGGRPAKKQLAIGNNLKNNMLLPGETLTLQFAEPIADDTVRFDSTVFAKADGQGLHYVLVGAPVDSANHVLSIPDSVFLSVRGRANDSLRITYRTAKASDLGNLFITVVPPPGTQAVVQLLNARNKVVETRTVRAEEKLAFKQLLPEKYQLKAILDTDGNGRWSTGDFHKRFLPETMLDYKDPLDIKAGWDIDLEEKWILFSE